MDFRQVLFGIVLVIATALAQHEHHEEHRVNVAVYYESLCPDSRKFITQQLYPSLQGNLSKFVNLTLVPYGKAKMKDENFECHHGPDECYGNIIQACALHKIDDGKKSEGLGYNIVATAFINCLMDKAKKDPTKIFPTKDCAEVNAVKQLHSIENCANHTDGLNYLSNYAQLTKAVMDPLKSVPTIVFNKQYKDADSNLAQTNFVQALCQYIHGDKPEECSRSSADMSKASLGFVLLTFLFIFY